MLAKLLAISVLGVGAIALIVGLSALFAWPVQLLWNGVAVHVIDGLHPLTFLQAWGLAILSGFLFKSISRK